MVERLKRKDMSIVEKRITDRGIRGKVLDIDLSRNLNLDTPSPDEKHINSLLEELREINKIPRPHGKSRKK
jgi:hypothetical protein